MVCRVAYIEGIKYVNLIEIGPVVTEIQGVENGKLAVPVNNTFVRHMAFLAADTRPCVLISQYGGKKSILASATLSSAHAID